MTKKLLQLTAQWAFYLFQQPGLWELDEWKIQSFNCCIQYMH